jgi:hypothetical protein
MYIGKGLESRDAISLLSARRLRSSCWAESESLGILLRAFRLSSSAFDNELVILDLTLKILAFIQSCCDWTIARFDGLSSYLHHHVSSAFIYGPIAYAECNWILGCLTGQYTLVSTHTCTACRSF